MDRLAAVFFGHKPCGDGFHNCVTSKSNKHLRHYSTMHKLLHPLLLLLARATDKELVQIIEFLKAENRTLRNKLPARIEITQAERATLLKLGVRLGSKIKDVISIVHPRTFARWLSESTSGRKPRKRGRPRKAEEIRQLVVEMATATGWGYRRIVGELK